MIALDTNVLVALVDERDELRERVARDLRKLIGKPMSVCGAVLTETCHLLTHPIFGSRIAVLLRELHVQSAEADSMLLWQEIFDWMSRYAEHEPDWADAFLAVASGRDRGLRVWTYDREFVTTWRRPDGTKIPLAVPIQ